MAEIKGKFPNGLAAAMKQERVGPTALADLIGDSKQNVTRWANQSRRLTPATAEKIAPHLHTTAAKLLLVDGPPPPASPPIREPSAVASPIPAVTEAPNVPNGTIAGPVLQTRSRTPIYGQGAGGDDGKFVLNGQKLGEIFTPPSLEGVVNAYTVYVHGDSMVERYRSGELVHVNPIRPVKSGDYVVIQVRTRDMDENETAGFVKRFVSRSDKEVVVEQFNPPKKLRFPRKDVVHIHKIVGSSEE